MELTATKIRVLIADDHAILRDGLRKLLSEEEDIEVVGEARDGHDALKKAEELKPDVILLDIAMPGLNGLAVAKKLKAAASGAKILILTMHQEEEYVYETLRAGASGYVLKDAAAPELVGAIRAAKRGEQYLSPNISRLVVKDESRAGGGKEIKTVSQHLTNREREVCKLLAEGHTVPKIASMIGISRKTVDVHKTRLMKKLDIHNRAELVKYSITNKLIEI
ncbi:MAG TPA: response regulator transcription factor [Planctomycetota bacterium]|nr:response regulator transcription factor [Planctomycetota bacterium]